MRILLLRAARADRNFNVGIGLVVIFAAAELFSVSFYYAGRIRAARMSAQPAIATMERHVSATPAPTLTQPEVSPAPRGFAFSPVRRRSARARSIELRDRGDTTNALARLHEASERDPKNAIVLEEIAKTYESMQLFDRSNEAWRKLQELGPSAGVAYELADRRLKMVCQLPPPPRPVSPVRHLNLRQHTTMSLIFHRVRHSV
jgi:hypothetical protein